MIGYLIEQELSNVLPCDMPIATLLTMVEVDPPDPAFQNLDWRIPQGRLLRHTTPQELEAYTSPAGSMGPKVTAACWFVRQTGQRVSSGTELWAALSDHDGEHETLLAVR